MNSQVVSVGPRVGVTWRGNLRGELSLLLGQAFRRRRPTDALLFGIVALFVGTVGLGTGVGHLGASVACAQAATEPEQREAAADAYDRGSAAYLSENWGQAGHWFELAHRFAPAAPALIQATRAYRNEGNFERAGTLALRLQALYPEDPTATETAEDVLGWAEGRLLRVDVACAECTIMVDDVILEHSAFFLPADEAHNVVAQFETGSRRVEVMGPGGTRREVSFEAPPAPPAAPTTDAAAPNTAGLSPAFAVTGFGLTAISAGLLLWSGVDTLDGVDAYEANPTLEGLEDGEAREARTNVLIGLTLGLGVVSLALLPFTDWGSEDDRSSGDPSPEREDEGPGLEVARAPVLGGGR